METSLYMNLSPMHKLLTALHQKVKFSLKISIPKNLY